ncbi:histidine kinase [Faecalicatena sp. AGMB00832]|uniref:Histidine kinase n=1 Tax=Faecalicatena faecalis TaxID=2726362 RepID=A0ABS6D9S6_9FIRM|nr:MULTISPECIES: histidine kinase [Faecalicatena]MBU3877871.1 histidine kinase [Faecalicatena faecalis]MCI6465439.1 histidine kinase [Faecalicatena sp.]MDY5617271.1 histidine kinase [Lachnospiraceae bacterium]
MKTKRKISVKSRIIALMLLCWLLPLIIITGVNIYYLYGSQFESKISKEIDQLKFNDQVSAERLGKVVESSLEASYDGNLMSLYRRYKRKTIMEHDLLASSMYYLGNRYGRDSRVKAAILWYRENPEKLNSSAYNTSEGATYQLVQNYWNEDHEAIAAISEDLGTAVRFYNNGSRLYLVRNLYNSNYENAAVLVLLVNEENCFENYSIFPEGTSVTLHIDDCSFPLIGEEVTKEETGMTEMGGSSGYIWENGVLRLYHDMKVEGHRMVSLVRFDNSSSFTLFYGYKAIMIGMALCLIPLLAILLLVFYRHVTKPIQIMMEGAEEIEKGNLGYQLEYEPESTEFKYLAESFNKMSERLKYQFDHIYEEELALRDARIMALQSHINPHFMNNTLEIINWEARLSGNQKVSQMIEALATLMDAGIDRKKQPEVLLSEEMIYVNAYLYIISERLGKRLTIKKELPEEIMQYKVPRLILQPVIENSIEHGVVKKGQGTVVLNGYKKGKYLYLEIVNEAVLTKEDEAKIERLLDVNYDTSKESSGSMGIANVNQRLKILYGEPCGLSMEKIDDEHVCARLTILVERS